MAILRPGLEGLEVEKIAHDEESVRRLVARFPDPSVDKWRGRFVAARFPAPKHFRRQRPAVIDLKDPSSLHAPGATPDVPPNLSQ